MMDKEEIQIDLKNVATPSLFWIAENFNDLDGKLLSRIRTATPKPEKLSRKDVEILHDVKRYLEKNFLDDLSLNTIIRKFGLNAFKLKYGFKTLFNTSVMRFIDEKKMNYARQLLCSDHDMFEVAERLGYNHYSNFSLAFKRRFGYSPTQVRALHNIVLSDFSLFPKALSEPEKDFV